MSTLTNQTRYVRDVRQSLRSNRQDRESVFSPEDISPDGEIRAPVLLGVRRDLTVNNGPEGLFGVCHRVYRVLYQVRLGPARECQKHRSRQSVLGDISDFYHTVSFPATPKEFSSLLFFSICPFKSPDTRGCALP
ncbi:hypothetical protein FGIG_11957 [Fasciola gigantica]|uniref:Uncharacterized protein n=1 Tax=Fasciola gigantica TaxID=46835 RepID=A0A504YRJ1_FASGI|nr:hypothetical protein FGIG_11957 [Fasciola gigantica]